MLDCAPHLIEVLATQAPRRRGSQQPALSHLTVVRRDPLGVKTESGGYGGARGEQPRPTMKVAPLTGVKCVPWRPANLYVGAGAVTGAASDTTPLRRFGDRGGVIA